MFSLLFTYGIMITLVVFVLRSRWFVEHNILGANAQSLALFRVVATFLLFLFVCGEGYPSVAKIPVGLQNHSGLLGYFLPKNGWQPSEMTIVVLCKVTLGFLLTACLGFFSRTSLGFAAVGCLFLGGLVRQYTHFFHQGLVPLGLITILACTPCGDVWSLDAWWRRRKNLPIRQRNSEAYGWARFACWCGIVLPYVCSGLAKIPNGQLGWIQPDNLRQNVLRECVASKGYNLDSGFLLLQTPDWLISTLAAAAVALELLAVCLLFFRWARFILPWGIVVMHVAIFWMQNIPFFDLMIIPLLFLEGNRRASSFAATEQSPFLWQRFLFIPVVLAVFIPLQTNTEFYPWTGWRMFAGTRTDGVVDYKRTSAQLADGRIVPFDFSCEARALHLGRQETTIARYAFTPKLRSAFLSFLKSTSKHQNKKAAPADRITAFIFEKRLWDFRHHADNPGGEVIQRVEIPVAQVIKN